MKLRESDMLYTRSITHVSSSGTRTFKAPKGKLLAVCVVELADCGDDIDDAYERAFNKVKRWGVARLEGEDLPVVIDEIDRYRLRHDINRGEGVSHEPIYTGWKAWAFCALYFSPFLIVAWIVVKLEDCRNAAIRRERHNQDEED